MTEQHSSPGSQNAKGAEDSTDPAEDSTDPAEDSTDPADGAAVAPPDRPGRRRPSRIVAVSTLAVGVAVLGAVIVAQLVHGGGGGGATSAGRVGGASDVKALKLTATTCGESWSLSTTGAAAFAIANDSGKAVEVTLRDAASDDTIIAEIERLPPRVTRQLSVTVNPGSYYWMCQFRDSTSARSQTVKVTGPKVPVAEPLLQVSADDMDQPVTQYKAYVAAQLTLLETQTSALQHDLTAGDATQAKADWLVAHQTYHRIGAAYGAFGDDGETVDGLAEGLPAGAADAGFTGFHKIEKELWSGATPTSVLPEALKLLTAVGVLRTKLPSFTFDPNDISLRTHEILEGTARFQLSGLAGVPQLVGI